MGWGFVEGVVAEHGEEHVGSSPREAEECLGLVLSLSDFLVVVGPGSRVGRHRERGQEEGPFELLASTSGRLFAPDHGARTAGCGGETDAGGEVGGSRERTAAADVDEDLAPVLTSGLHEAGCPMGGRVSGKCR